MSAERPTALAGSRTGTDNGFDPLRSIWSLLINVKFALMLLGAGVLTGLLGTILPQIPAPMRTNPAARSAWLELQRDDLGPLTRPLDALGLFDVFHSPWFSALWATIILAVTVCTVSRLRPVWRSVNRPRRSVSEAYFDRALHRHSTPFKGDPETVVAVLRARRYSVDSMGPRGASAHLFADRFAWAQYGTFLSHLALLVLLIGGLLTVAAGKSRRLVVAESAPAAPVFATPGPGQLFLRVVDASRGIDPEGNVVDFHTDVEVRRGDQTVACRVTVNGPCETFGYRVHQAAFFDDFVRVRLAGGEGEVLFDDIVDFGGRTTPVPRMLVTDRLGETVFDGPVPQLATERGTGNTRADDSALGLLTIRSGEGGELESIPLLWRTGRSFELTAGTAEGPQTLAAGEGFAQGELRVEFAGPVAIPAIQIDDFPASNGTVTFQLTGPAGGPHLVVSGLAEQPLEIEAGAEAELEDGMRLTFVEPLEGAGLDVRRDPGDSFVWIGITMALTGLAITFYVPRRRVWARVGEGRLSLAAVAERGVRLEGELRTIAEMATERERSERMARRRTPPGGAR